MSSERLYDLLPGFYRDRDARSGYPLRELLDALQVERNRMHLDIWHLYDGWFVETCPAWALPLIGDLVGIPRVEGGLPARRAQVANALRHRKRKGTPAALQGAARDASGWAVRVVELFDTLALSEPLRDLPATLSRQVDLEPTTTGRPLARHTRSVSVRGTGSAEAGSAREVALVVHRLDACPVWRSVPGKRGPGRYTFDPLGRDVPLFQQGPLPAALDARALRAELDAHRAALAGAGVAVPEQRSASIGPGRSVAVWVEGEPVPAERFGVAALDDWRPDDEQDADVWLDPERGRLAFSKPPKGEVRVDWAFGRPAPIGAGPWAREPLGPLSQPWCAVVSAAWDGTEPGRFPTLGAALAAWPADADGYVRILDSGTYDAVAVDLGARQLVVEAEPGERPCLVGDLAITGSDPRARCDLGGLLLSGAITLSGDLACALAWCTTTGGLSAGTRDLVDVTLDHCEVGPVRLPSESAVLTATDTIVAGAGGAAIDGPDGVGPILDLRRCTLLGPVRVAEVGFVSGCLFADVVQVLRTHDGLILHSTYAAGSTPPATRHCLVHGDADQGTALSPRFVSLVPTDPGYAQLVPDGGPFLEGSRDGAEVGAFHDVLHPQRLLRLQDVLLEYVPAGLVARIAFAN